jgi:peptide/nickel transport system permease protein
MKKLLGLLSKLLKYVFMKIYGFLKLMYSNKKAGIGFSVILFFILMALVGPYFFKYDGITTGSSQFLPPSGQHWLGTDYLGRDVLQMLIDGAGEVLSIAFLTGIITVLIGSVLGILSAYIGGVFDRVIQLITNLFLTIPSFPILMVLATIITINSNLLFAIILSIWSWPGLCRAVRSQISSLRERDFIQICKVMNMPKRHIIFKELIPNIASYILINFIMIMRGAITGSVGLMMLGVAALEPSNWGAMIFDIMNQGVFYIPSATAYLISPIAFIVVFQFGIIMLANGLDEKLNPRLIKS